MGPIRGMLSSVDITEQQWRVLRVLQENGPMEPTRIAEEACLLLPSLTRILQKLDEKEMIRRRPDQADRRKQIVQISKTGEQIITSNLDKSLELSAAIRRRMGEDRHDLLLDLLNELENAEALNQS